MSQDNEVNRLYVAQFRGASGTQGADVGRRRHPLLDSPLAALVRPLWRSILRLYWGREDILRILLLPLLLLLAPLMIGFLKVNLWRKKPTSDPLYLGAAEKVRHFTEQYPFHMYAVLAKSFEWAYLEQQLERLVPRDARILEVAIGEGTLSARVFEGHPGIVGLDLNPLSLLKASKLPHVKQSVVCDCIDPPIESGTFDGLVANNFVSHVTDKGKMLRNWSRIARVAMFNDETPYWGTSWAGPYMLRRLGFAGPSQRNEQAILRDHSQCLLPKPVLDEIVSRDWEASTSVSYMSERTFFYCALFSFLMRYTGPPVPMVVKRLLTGPFRFYALSLTATLGHLLIQFDCCQDRSRDTFVSYALTSKRFRPSTSAGCLLCPKCRGRLDDGEYCARCLRQYGAQSGMLFLLPDELQGIEAAYDPKMAEEFPREHL